MTPAQRNARVVAANPGAEALPKQQQRRQSTAKSRRRKPAYAKQFRLGPRQTAIVCLGWPPCQPPAQNVLVLPPGEPPAAFDWVALRDQYALCTPPPDEIADHQILRELAAELAAAGVAGLVLWDGECIAGEWWRDAPQAGAA